MSLIGQAHVTYACNDLLEISLLKVKEKLGLEKAFYRLPNRINQVRYYTFFLLRCHTINGYDDDDQYLIA